MSKMSINVTYTESFYQNKLEYVCNITKTDFRQIKTPTLNGRHINGKLDNDVTMLSFQNCNFIKIPQFLLKFQNLRIFVISKSNLKKLTMADMDAYRNLQIVDITKTGLKFLPGNLFTGFENLQEIYFNNNQLDVIEPNILDGLYCLKIADFKFNSFHNLFYCTAEMDLSEFRKVLIRNFLGVNPDTVVSYIENLQKHNRELMNENEEMSEKIDDLDNCDIQQQMDYGYMKYYDELCELSEQNMKLQIKIEELESKPKDAIQSDLEGFLLDDSTKDFKIIIDGHEFKVHKFLLAARSPTLAEILKNNPEADSLNLVDISVEIFEKILKFLYTDELLDEDGTNFLCLFAAAGKLKIPKLMKYAAGNIIELGDLENPLEVLLMSKRYEHEELKQKALKEVKKKYPNIQLKDKLANDMEKLAEFVKIMKIKEETDKKIKEFIKN